MNGTRSGSASLLLLDSVARLAGLWTVEELWFGFFLEGTVASVLDLRALSPEATGGSPSRLFNLYILLHPNKDIPHLGDVILHQIFVEGVSDLQLPDEGGSGCVLISRYSSILWPSGSRIN